ADGCDRGGDLGVGGRHDLAAVAEVDLVTVVLRRIVRSGDHDARVAAEVADGEGEYGCGQRLRKQVRTYPGGLHDLGGVTGEHIGVVSRVEPDDDARVGTGVASDVRREAVRRLRDDDPVHAVRAGAECAAQTGRAELQRAGEAVGELGSGRLVGTRAREQGRELV